ncbi:MAG: hypothetical protein A2Y25_08870 [Candidatus Melainabacteria bacterium GWF2_37_15]|nr:MAG: hypothetical protein A2Y25_08870 [Candidatus Melainabacteria bacterium GWF2_37_15]
MSTVILNGNPYINHKRHGPSFGSASRLLPQRKKELKALVNNFIEDSNFSEERRNTFGRIVHFGTEIGAGLNGLVYALHGDWGSASFHTVFAMYNHGLDKLFHNVALRKSKLLIKQLKKQGIKDKEELRFSISNYLGKRGGIIHSNLFRLFSQKKIEKLVETGKLPEIKGIIYKIHRKYEKKLLNYLERKIRNN